MLITIKMVAVSAITLAAAVTEVPTKQLERYYWDCDTMFMQERLSGSDLHSCLAITEELQSRLFKNNSLRFKQYWDKNKLHEWNKRGYTPKNLM